MDSLILTYFKYAQLAQASYSRFNSGSSRELELTDEGTGGFSEKQASEFLKNYTLVSHQPNTAEGFSASVFKSASGEYVLAIRGTEMDPAGLISDVGRADVADIGLNGISISQAIDLFNYYQRLTAVAGQPLVQYQYEDGLNLPFLPGYSITAGSITYSVSTASETGVLAGKHFTVTGHSLGGHLAMIMGRLAGDSADAVYTYNAPGFDAWPGNSNTEWFFAALRQAQSEATGQASTIATGFNQGKMTNLVVPGDIVSEIGTVPGQTLIHFDEKSDLSGAHSIVGMTDSLALQSLFAKIDPTLTFDVLSGILKASSAEAGTSLEKALDVLRTLFEQSQIDSNAPATAVDNRDAFYTNLYALEGLIDEQALPSLSIHSLAAFSGEELADLARSDIAYRYALYKLNAFVVSGNDSLYARVRGSGALDLHDPVAGTGNITAEWIADRAEYLDWILNAALSDSTEGRSQSDPLSPDANVSLYFEDYQNNASLYVGGGFTRQSILFGSQYDEDLTGSSQNDRLYGGDGADTLFGNAGSDYLEGGTGEDRLYGGIGSDTLRGMSGSDTLDGGAGNDTLTGGAGGDRYEFHSGDGSDLIIDDDGQGSVWFDDLQLTGGKETQEGSGIWKSEDDKTTYSLVSNPDQTQSLYIQQGSDLIRVQAYELGQLGITLEDSEGSQSPSPDLTLVGDKKPVDFDAGQEGDQIDYDELGNVISTDAVEVRDDALYGGAGNDLIQGLDGKDSLSGKGGNDTLEGGADQDRLNGGADNDLLIGGEDSDILRGDEGDDQLYATTQVSIESVTQQTQGSGQKGDWLTGGLGEDVVVGDASDDVLFGGGGKDTLWGGAGDDALNGDDNYIATSFDWTVTDYGNPFDRLWSPVQIEQFALDVGDNDFLYGGAGNDWLGGSIGNDWLFGEADQDTLSGGSGDDLLFGGDDNDLLTGDYGQYAYDSGTGQVVQGNDTLDGGTGDDLMQGEGGYDHLIGGSGNDTLRGDASYLAGADHGNDQLEGGLGNDMLFGEGGNDALYGGEGNDEVVGDQIESELAGQFHGKDTLDGGAGTDTLAGGGGDDELHGGSEDDQLQGDFALSQLAANFHGNDLLYGDAGNDKLWGNGGNDTLYGGADNDQLQGDASDLTGADGGNDVLIGGAGQDTLTGGGGNDTLNGGADFDYLVGGAGDDTYIFDRGNGPHSPEGYTEFIEDNEGANTIEFGAGIKVDDVNIFLYPNGELLLQYSGTDDVFMAGGLSGSVKTVKFADGSSYSLQSLFARNAQQAVDVTTTTADADLVGSAGSNQLAATGGGSTFQGGCGDDTLIGGGGANLYLYERGDGVDHIYDTGGYTLPDGTPLPNRVQFGTGIRQQDVRLSVGSDGSLEVLVAGAPTGKLVIHNFNSADATNSRVIEFFDFADGTTLTYDALLGSGFKVVGSAEDDSLQGSNLADQLFGGFGNDTLSAGAGNDLLQGGVGNDLLDGGAGADLYLYTKGQGTDTLVETADGSTNTLRFAAGLTAADIELAADASQNLILRIKNTNDSLVLSNWLATDSALVQRIEFADGTLWTPEWIRQNLLVQSGTSGNDVLTALAGQASTLYGLAGNDTLNGSAGDDQLVGGTGNDSLAGGAGNDRYLISLGDGQDSVTETAGTDAVEYLTGVSSSDISVKRVGSDLLLMHLNGTDKLTLRDWYAYTDGRSWVEEVRFADGTAWIAAQLTQQGLTQVGSDGNDNLQGINNFADTLLGGSGSDYLYGYSGDDSLNGGAGYDFLYGGDGSDTLVVGLDGGNADGGTGDDAYIYSAGDGPLWLSESGGSDVLRFGPGITSDDVQFSKNYGSLRLTLADGGVVDIYNWFVSANGAALIERIEFADGTTWDAAAIQTQISAHIATEGSDSLIGYGTNDFINGLGGNDTIYGYAGDDSLDGGLGNDSLIGGTGDDTYTVDSAADVVTENANEGTDTVQSSVSYTVSNDVENLTLIGSAAINGTGNALNNMLVGNGAANTLKGGAGHDTLDGGTGNDTLIGGIGNDIYIIDTLSDVLTENASEGTDTIVSGFSYTLAANFENLNLTGTAALNGTGNTLNNVVAGNSGDNALDGGAGIDTLVGGAGNDTYVVDTSADVIIENAGEGIDLVQSAASYSLSANIENLTLTGTGAINGTGNNLNNILVGNSGNNVLTGGLGDDTYVVTAGDTVIENANEGIDIVQSALTYTLGTNIENLTLTGTGTVSGTGNELNNIIIGNSAKNKLTGGTGDDRLEGGGGTDTLIGGAGNDYYVIDDSRDAITENANEGIDTVQSAFTYTLATNLENLTLAASLAINGTGNAVNNVIMGNELSNILNGAAGIDTLIGGNGNDTYVVENINDVIVENAGEGTDLVQSSVTYALSANVENLTLTGTSVINGSGNSLNNILTGNTAANVLAGGAGDDIYIIAAGDSVIENVDEGVDTVQSAVTYTLGSNLENLTLTGTSAINGTGNSLNNILTGNSGNNVFTGGAGDDIYVVGSGDTVVENADGGTDTVQSAVTHTLSANVENLTLIGTSSINATGNGLNNILIGNSAANVLTGGVGDDTYFVGIGDSVVEEINGGTDTVQSSVTFTLAANLENLTLTGIAAINGTGNSGNNILIGNDGNNLLDGDVGADTMSGGLGDDIYVIDSAADVVIENAGEGTDTIQSTMSYASGGNIENITLLGTEAINATGDATNNVLTGNSAANVLTGAGGNDTLNGGGGSDTLVGGTGDDTYILGSASAVIIENALEGIDTVQIAATYSLEMDANLENLTLTGVAALNGTGNSSNNVITGNDGNNVLDGGAGSDKLYGGLGNDTLYGTAGDELRGGAGDDLYILTGASELKMDAANWQNSVAVYESDGSGIDTIQADFSVSLVSYSYWSNADSSIHYVGTVENATLTGSANATVVGNDGDNVLIGNTGNNKISSLRGNDTMDGGAGNDTLQGGYGNSTLIGGAGNDRIELNGAGSASMIGGVGDDWYYLYYGDVGGTKTITENLNEGIDTVDISYASSYTLGDNIENLRISSGTGIGNALDNVITGGGVLNGMGGNDTLDGSGYSATGTLSGGTGNDTYIVGAADVITENLNEGTDTVQSSLSYTLGANVENLTLTGTAAINGTGNSLNNVLIGNAYANVLTGGLGDDTYVAASNDTLVENADEGIDTVQAANSYTLGVNLENLTLTGTATAVATGNTLNNVLTGNGSANVLDGGLGADTMKGAAGDDTYVVDNSADVVTENASEGSDTIQSSVSYTASANVENLVLTGTAAIDGSGNALNNTLTGNSAANVLSGGLGDDTYVIGAGDTAIENANEGVDTVQSSASYTLGANLENLTLTGSSSINGAGNSLNNILTGNSAANALSGGLGDDTYVIGYDTNDSLIENANEGIDTVQSSASHTLGANLENLILMWGTAGTGNSLDNTLTGNELSNTLDGGLGADTLVGGSGYDTYLIDNTGDVVIENVGEGTDTVHSTVSHALSANVENLVLLGASAIDGTGNGLDNQLTGNSAANTLAGGAGNDTLDGGTGVDTMVGGTGNDTFVVDTLGDVVTESSNEGVDTVRSSINYTLGVDVENLVLVGASMLGSGNALNNVLDAKDTSADTLVGGLGDDTYVIDALDAVTENTDEGIDTIQIAATYTLGADIENLTLTGSGAINGTGNVLDNLLTGNTAANTLTGAAGNDMLDGGAGVDSLVGGIGDDTYRLGRGYGADTVVENDATAGNADVAQFLSGIATDQLWFRHASGTDNLEVSIIGTTDKLTIKDWYVGSANHVEQFKTADGKTLLDSQVQNLVDAMAAFAPPTAGQTSLPSNYHAALDAVIASNWQ